MVYRPLISLLCFLMVMLVFSDPASAQKRAPRQVDSVEYGTASFYAKKFEGRPTASGELYDAAKMTAAHNHLPFGTRIRVTNTRNKRSVIVKVNDRLHYKNTRLVDLSYAAASKLGFIGRGLTRVKVEILEKKEDKQK